MNHPGTRVFTPIFYQKACARVYSYLNTVRSNLVQVNAETDNVISTFLRRKYDVEGDSISSFYRRLVLVLVV